MIQDFRIVTDGASSHPLFIQIVEQVKQAVANNRLQPGERLPTVRQLAQSLGVNPGTVARAYLTLEQEKIVVSHRGGGTKVADQSNNPAIAKRYWNHLSNIVNGHILEALSLGYTPEELEAVFSLHLARWREERKEGKHSIEIEAQDSSRIENEIVIEASHDLALELLINKLKAACPEMKIKLNHSGSLGGLVALQKGRADLAGIHLLDEETGEYNYPYLKHLLPGRKMAVVHLAYRVQGLILAKNNPKRIRSLEDLRRREVTLINRQTGSGTRVLLDFELHKLGIEPSKVNGYEHEVNTHIAVALGVSRGEADVGLGIQAAAESNGLDFLPLLKERYDLVIPKEKYKSMAMAALLKIIKSADFKEVVANIGGYDTSKTGSTTFV